MDTFKCALCNQMCFELNNAKGNDICENCRKQLNVNDDMIKILIALKEVLKQYSNVLRYESQKMVEIRESFAK